MYTMEISREIIQSDVTVVDEICILKNKNQQIFKKSVTNVYNANTWENYQEYVTDVNKISLKNLKYFSKSVTNVYNGNK